MTCFSIHGKHLLHVVPETAAEAPTEDAATYSTLITEGIRSSNVLLISDHGQGVIASETARTLIDTAQKAGKPAVVDPTELDFSTYHGAAVRTPAFWGSHWVMVMLISLAPGQSSKEPIGRVPERDAAASTA